MTAYDDEYAELDDASEDRQSPGFWLIVLPLLWLLVFFLLPFAGVLKVALSDVATGILPYAPVIDPEAGWEGLKALKGKFDFGNFLAILNQDIYWQSFLSGLKAAVIATVITLLLAYPMAYSISRASRWRTVLLVLVVVPFLAGDLIRVYAWMGMMQFEGLFNHWLMATGLLEEPLRVLNTQLAVYSGMVYSCLPLMILPLYLSFRRVDAAMLEAARDLGCSRRSAFWKVVYPLSWPGVVVGCLLVFIPAMGEFLIPGLLSDAGLSTVSHSIWTTFSTGNNWPMASALSLILLALLLVPILFFQRRARALIQEVKA